MSVPSKEELARIIAQRLTITDEKAMTLVETAEHLYIGKMQDRFSEIRVKNRIKRTNPFLLRIRGVTSVKAWAEMQLRGALFASEEEAVGHLLENIAKICHPGARDPVHPEDFDYEVSKEEGTVGYQVKMSWDCMPMSSRKNLSRTTEKLKEIYAADGKSFTGVFAPCYGRATTSQSPGQQYLSLASREFWTRVGNGDEHYDVKVGEVCALICSEFRATIESALMPDLVQRLAEAAEPIIGNGTGAVDYPKLFRAINS